MPIYEIEVVVQGGTAQPITATLVRDLLTSLLGDARLDASAIKNLSAAGYQTPEAVRAALESLSGNNRLNATAIRSITKAMVFGAERAINLRTFADIWGSSSVRSSIVPIARGDLFVQKDTVSGPGMASNWLKDKDWIIALIDITVAPTQADLQNSTKFYKVPISELYSSSTTQPPSSETAYLRANPEGGTELMKNEAEATGDKSIALGYASKALKAKSVAIGAETSPSVVGGVAFGTIKSIESGDMQKEQFQLASDTFDNEPYLIQKPDRLVLENSFAYRLKITVTGVSSNTGDVRDDKYEGVVSISDTGVIRQNINKTTTTIGDMSEVSSSVAIETESTLDGDKHYLNIRVTGRPYEQIRFNVFVEYIATTLISPT